MDAVPLAERELAAMSLIPSEKMLHDEIEKAEQRAVERVLGTLVSVLREMKDEGGARDSAFEELFRRRLTDALNYEIKVHRSWR